MVDCWLDDFQYESGDWILHNYAVSVGVYTCLQVDAPLGVVVLCRRHNCRGRNQHVCKTVRDLLNDVYVRCRRSRLPQLDAYIQSA